MNVENGTLSDDGNRSKKKVKICAVKLQIVQTEKCPNGWKRERETETCNWEENCVELRNRKSSKVIRLFSTSVDIKIQFKVSLSF